MRVPAPICAFAVCLTLGATGPGSASAQVPTVESQPRVAVPAREAVIKAAPPSEAPAPVAETPGQPPAAPTAAAPTEPAPVSAAPPPSGVTQLPPAAPPPATASSSAAATAKHSYGASNFVLELDGVNAGSVKAVEGGAAVGTVVNQGSKKHLAGVKYEELSFGVGIESKAVVEWIKATWDGGSARKNLSVSVADFNYKIVGRREFMNALLTGTTIPALDAGSKDPVSFTLTVAPEQVREIAGDGSAAKFSDTKGQKRWLLSNFRFEMGDLPGKRVSRIESFTVGQKVTEDQVGVDREALKQPGTLVFPNLKVTLSQADAAEWAKWHNDFVVNGKNDDAQEKNGAIVFLDPTLKNEFGRVNLFNCGIFRFGAARREANADKVAQVTADLYCERMELVAK